MAHIDIEDIIGNQDYIVNDSVCHALLDPIMYGNGTYFKIIRAKIFKNFKIETIDSSEIGCDIYLGIKDFDNNLKILKLSEEATANIEKNMPTNNDDIQNYITSVVDNLIEDGYLIITGDTKAITKYKLKI